MKISPVEIFVQRAKFIGIMMLFSAVFYIASRLIFVVG